MPTNKRVSEVVARPTRTLIQATPAYAIVEFVDAFLWNMTERQFGAAIVLLTLVISAAQTALENNRGGGLLREVPPTEVPAVDAADERGQFDVNFALKLALVVLVVLVILALLGVV